MLRIGIATDHLSTKFAETPPDNTCWINPAPLGGSTVIDLAFTNDSEAALRDALKFEPAHLEHQLLAHRHLPSGEAFSIIRTKRTKHLEFWLRPTILTICSSCQSILTTQEDPLD